MADHLITIVDNVELGPDRPKGFVVCAYKEQDGETVIYMPDWRKMGYGDLAVVFPTREAAERAVPISF